MVTYGTNSYDKNLSRKQLKRGLECCSFFSGISVIPMLIWRQNKKCKFTCSIKYCLCTEDEIMH